ncbi:cyclophane-forming radical SAM/SPASM peptide maturase GrrM/OscB [Chitinophaga sp. MM2321]|uniref:cyclophane-forming radical SAM/SPASM peptide maturase GrrM/OscB n=1 Tax=Chitinophaga sp. MM2321 TaxID=3137178 RepID=UPI0032D5711C
MKGVDLVVIQPTPFCNINCSYCYLPQRNNTKRISETVVNRVVSSLIDNRLIHEQISVVWHAGEPLVLPPSFYSPLFDIFSSRLAPLGMAVSHCIQTNGTLITQEWCDFILRHNIRIGVSIDGPADIHNANRKTRSGKGTFDEVMKGIALLQENKIPYHGIAVISKHSLKYARPIFDFFYENGFYQLGLNIEEIEGINNSSTLLNEDLTPDITAFYKTIFDLYLTRERHMQIREFDHAFNAILRNPEQPDISKLVAASHQNTPLSILSIDYEGNFSSFSPELIGQHAEAYNDFIFGNILETGFTNGKRNDLLEKVAAEINSGIHQCKATCEYFHVCGGGAPSNKFFENGRFDSTETKYCKYNIKVPVRLVLGYLEEKLFIS